MVNKCFHNLAVTNSTRTLHRFQSKFRTSLFHHYISTSLPDKHNEPSIFDPLMPHFWHHRLPERVGLQKIVLKKVIFRLYILRDLGKSCTFALFFMVLDLRLVKIGCRETINFFCTYTKNAHAKDKENSDNRVLIN